MPIFGAIVDRVCKEAEEEKVKESQSAYWLECPGCGKRVVRKGLLSKGCYVCGWHEASNEIELAKIMCDSSTTAGADKKRTSYRTNCPRCKARVIGHELMERGCYICGFVSQ